VTGRARRTIVALLALGAPAAMALLLASAVPAAAAIRRATALPPVDETDGRGGVCYAFYYEHGNRPFLPLAYSAGARYDRVDFRWDAIDANGYEGHETLVDDDLAAGIEVTAILMATPYRFRAASCDPRSLGREVIVGERPPGWYEPEPIDGEEKALAGSDPGACPAAGLYNPWSPANFNGNHWAQFVYQTVSYFRGRVQYWEMWNEPDWAFFWLGSEADYAQLLKVGYKATKAACPECTVLFGGLHFWADQGYFERVLDILNDDPWAAANNYFFDVLSVHMYSRSSAAYEVLDYMRQRMQAYVPDHPIWLTETGVQVHDGVNPGPQMEYSATEAEAAAYVLQSYANAIAAGVERYYWFRMHDDVMPGFGLAYDPASLRETYVAYQVATSYLVSPTLTTRIEADPDVNVTLWGTPRGKVSVLWNSSPTATATSLMATMPSATLVDRSGASHSEIAVNGVFTLSLPGASAYRLEDEQRDYFIGGDPLLLIESEEPNEPPTCTVHALPSTTYTDTFTVEWDGYDRGVGVWLYEVGVRDRPDGQWVLWKDQVPVTSSPRAAVHNHTYEFRCRALDQLGNRGEWPTSPQARTTIDLSASLHLQIGALFADENRNGTWDLPASSTNEIALTDVSLYFIDETGQPVQSVVGASSWEFTATILAGQEYRLVAVSRNHMWGIRLIWPRAKEAYTETYDCLGLRPTARTALPVVMNSYTTAP
jgi:hypothetical protein